MYNINNLKTMKSIIKDFTVAIVAMASCTALFAQNDVQQRTGKGQRMSREQFAVVQAKHIASELAFSDEVTEKFVKTYCEYQKEVWALEPRQGRSDKDKKELSEQESEKQIKARFARSEQILNIRKKYYEEYSKFLLQSQIEQVYEQESKVKKRLSRHGDGKRGKERRGKKTADVDIPSI